MLNIAIGVVWFIWLTLGFSWMYLEAMDPTGIPYESDKGE